MKRVMFIIIGLLILSGLYAAATNKISEDKSKEISTLNDQISNIQYRLDRLQVRVDQLFGKDRGGYVDYVVFTPSDKEYATLHANVGYFVVSLDSLKKYGNGYRATFNIGNPNAMIFKGIKVGVQWGEAYPFKSEEIDINKSLLPGVWNKVSIVLSPATANEIGFIRLALKANNVSLSADLRESSD
jgi:hypothetical protein